LSQAVRGTLGRVAKSRNRPGLVFFSSRSSGRCRRVEAFLAQVLQRRANHSTFKLYTIDVDEHPKLATHFKVAEAPVLVVIEDKRVLATLEQPKHANQIEAFLAPWLQ
jgi:thioredoxin-like negative regulator of GroEL